MLFRARKKESLPSEGGFTEYVRSLEGGEPDAARFAALCRELRAVLRAELRRRGLWSSPPEYLGIYGWKSWEEGNSREGDALDELRADAYTFVFLDRLRSLRSHLAVKPNIDGLVFLAVRQFIQERQEKHDPLGAQVYAVLRTAVRGALEAGELRLVGGSDRIVNDTVLGFGAGADSEPQDLDLRLLAARWNDRLLPDLVTHRGRKQEEVVRHLRGLLPELRDEGVEVFRFKDLIGPLKADVRARWGAVFEREGGETALEEGAEIRRVRLTQPDLGVEERQFLRKVIACVLESVARLDVNETTRGYLYRLWQFRRVQAESEAGDDRDPSARKLGDLLRIPRERIPDLSRKLVELVEGCRAANSGKLAVTS